MLKIENGCYHTPQQKISPLVKLFPSAVFYLRFLGNTLRNGRIAKQGKYDDAAWEKNSLEILSLLESVGVTVDITGFEYLENRDRPAVFIGNHMSMMETLLLPGFIRRTMPATFIIKESLLHYPVFKYIMRSRNPIAVTRTNPRKDLQTVFTEGQDRLKKGISIVVFPQTTRTFDFNPRKMSSIGTKLAQKAEVDIIPVALKTDAWENGTWIKDLGKINTHRKARFAFGSPITAEEDNKQEKVVSFIAEKLQHWQAEEE